MEEIKEKTCNICGSKLIWIRGKYPKQHKRKVCACCAVEKLESIKEQANMSTASMSHKVK